ncbi:MAG: PAS domain S-box protein, partial [Gemmatimonadales bacterium]
MSSFSASPVARYGAAVTVVAIAVAVRHALDPILGVGNVVFITVYPAVVAAAWLGGRWPGLLASFLSVCGVAIFVAAPAGGMPVELSFWAGALVFAAMGVVITALIESMRTAHRDADSRARELKLREEWLRVTLTSIGDAVIATDLDGRVTLINTVACELTGWSNDALGEPLESVFQIISERTRERTPTPVARVLREGVIVDLANHTLLVARDGTDRPIEDSAAPIRDEAGKIVGVVLVFRDATAQRRAEDGELRSRERLQLALASGHLGVWEWDLATNAVWWSDEVARLHGMEPGEFGGTLEAFQALVHSDDRERVGLLVQGAIEARSDYAVQFRTTTPAGEIRWISGKAAVFCDDDGTPVRMVGVTSDVTEQRATEEALRLAGQRKDEFLATLAHELRNPLAPIRNALEIVRLVDTNPVEPVRGARDMIERQVGQMTRLLDDLLDVSRITRDRLELRREVVQLGDVLEVAVEASVTLLRAGGRSFTLDLPAAAIWVDADHTRLVQVFTNLLNNAAKFTRPGGRITLTACGHEHSVDVMVDDDGIGIAPADRQRLFEMFEQGATTNGDGTPGLGIGLTIARRLVEMHGGGITVQAGSGDSGTTFTVRLPVVGAPVGVSAPDDGATELGVAGGGLRVLVADDNHDATNTLTTLLRLWGHEVESAFDGRAAVERAGQFRPQVALLDIGMPELSGYDVARQLRADGRHDGLRLVAITGWG